MTKPLIPIWDAIKRTRGRREVDFFKTSSWYKATFFEHNRAPEYNIRSMTIWIAENTTGRFFLSPTTVAFRDEKDFVTFKMGFGDQHGFKNG